MSFELTHKAEVDLIEIWAEIARSSPQAADRVIDRFFALFEELAAMPGIGHFREDIANRTIKFSRVFDYLVAYRHESSPVVIVRIIHGARDLPNQLD